MLTDDGMVIKVIPEKNYLKELRDIFYGHTYTVHLHWHPTYWTFKNFFKLRQT